MNIIELQEVEASLLDPNDPVETNIVVDAAGVGRTNRLATGQILTWTAEKLRAFASTMVGMPINVDLDEDGEATGHSRRAVGAVTKAEFDEGTQTLRATGSVWAHYYPSLASRLKELFTDGRVEPSMEFTPTAELQSNADGSETPTAGRFSGLALVRRGADPRARALLMASVREDLERQPVEVQMNLEQITEAVARRLGYREGDTDAATRTVADDAETESEEISASEDDADTSQTEDAALGTEISEELKASLREELLAELQPRIAALETENATLKAEKVAADEAAAKDALAATRADELNTIVPVDTDEARTRRLAAVRDLSDEAFATLKAELAAVSQAQGGIASDAERHAANDDDENALTDEQLDTWLKEAQASMGIAATTGKGE